MTNQVQGLAPSQATARNQRRILVIADQTERAARLLVRALHYATDGERRWWVLPTKLNDQTKEAVAGAVDRAGCSIGATASA
jgi:hypothetical protein